MALWQGGGGGGGLSSNSAQCARAARMKMPLVTLTAGNTAIVCQWPPTAAASWVATCSNSHPLDHACNLCSRRSRDLVVENRGGAPRQLGYRYDEESTQSSFHVPVSSRSSLSEEAIRQGDNSGLVWGTTTKQPIWVRRNDITAFSNDGKERRGKTGIDRARRKGWPHVARTLQGRPGRSDKQQQQQNSLNLGTTF